MKKLLAVAIAITIVSIMICGCAKKSTQETDVQIVGNTEAPTENKIVINDEKPAETVERVPEQVEALEETRIETEVKTVVAAPSGQSDKSEATSVETGVAPQTDETNTNQAQADQAKADQAQAEQEKAEPAKADAAKNEGDIVSNDYSAYAGKYTRTEDGSTFELGKDGKVKIGITRLTEMEGKAEGIYKNIIKMTVKDANDGDMKLEFLTDTNELVVTGSTWSLLPNGETFKFDKKD